MLFTWWVRFGAIKLNFCAILNTVMNINVFHVFKSNSKAVWNTRKFYLNQCSRILFFEVVSNNEREFRLEFALLLSANEVDVFLLSLKIKDWIALAKLNWCGGFSKSVKMVQTVYDLCQPSMFTTTFPVKPHSSFFLPLGQFITVWPQTRKWPYPECAQPKLFPHGEPWGRRLEWPPLVKQ